MSSSLARPLVRRRDDGLQLSYQLPHRVYAAKPYPVLAPNGSAIVIYGYENGLRIIWRGGRSFLPLQKPAVSEKSEERQPNGTHDDAVMIIDSDDEEPAPEPAKVEQPAVQFEDEETEVDASHPYEQILRHIDIPLGMKVLGVAVPSFLPEKARSSLEAFPPILTKMIVVSAICADSSTRVVVVPLTPPHPTNTEPSTWGIQTLSMSGSVSHNEIPTGVSITFTCQAGGDDSTRSRSQRRASFSRVESAPARDGEKWELLVATHAAEATGTLLVYRIPVIERSTRGETSFTLSPQHLHPIQRHALPAPAKSISFNPSPYPSERHANLLVAFPDGYVKILSCLATKSNRTSRGTDSETVEPEGRWLITLYPGFEQSADGFGRRKTVIDAAWVLAGRAVMVLLADGEWGVWDVEGSGPGSEPGPLRGQSSIHGVTGGSLTSFAVSGRIVGNPQTSKSQVGGGGPTPPDQRAKFAPMTPSTRRVREDSLFKGAQSPSSPSLCGELSVVQINSSRDPAPEESILIRHGDQIATIPSLLSLWRNAVKSTGTFDASSRCRVTNIGNVHLLGERLTGISHLPAAARKEREANRREFDTLITAEHRLIILAPKLTGSGPQQQAKTGAELHEKVQQPSAETDQLMLRRGELDVDGMDRVLSGMAGGSRFRSPLKRTRVFT
ncbi:hypothetical protein VTN96DRAFT_8872 [Rasamsonia emersonii]|uniref:Nucleoporin NUP37 n=1 Tax=Rasamsonia emersonii (strain ATCC 16479 / CBS 393.64 / IMI 116815) TaxID=1408163 RepID=A0A0F4Z3B1_RASE3|nr:hypothetical protein T310_1184 [Rasamsonia emersonii CBS 393.64]KKA24825.1 hypothetical protein T310_1184 [Rasamsonia emersonii CBS 393.64]